MFQIRKATMSEKWNKKSCNKGRVEGLRAHNISVFKKILTSQWLSIFPLQYTLHWPLVSNPTGSCMGPWPWWPPVQSTLCSLCCSWSSFNQTRSRGQWPIQSEVEAQGLSILKFHSPCQCQLFPPGCVLDQVNVSVRERDYLLLGKSFFSERVLATLIYLGFLHTLIGSN